jgi:signal peptidase
MTRLFTKRDHGRLVRAGARHPSAITVDSGFDEVRAVEAAVAAAVAASAARAARVAASQERPPAAQEAPGADKTGSSEGAAPSAEKVGGIKLAVTACRELVRMVAVTYLSTYLSLGIWGLLPMVIGWTPTVVISGSMRPAIDVGDVLFFAPEKVSTIAPGRVVLVDDPAMPGHLLSHRVYKRNDDGTLVTKGDANAGPDSTPVRPEHVRGAARLVIPHVGKVTLWRGENRTQAAVWTGLTMVALLLAGMPGRTRGRGAPDPAAPDPAAPATDAPSSGWRDRPGRRRRVRPGRAGDDR